MTSRPLIKENYVEYLEGSIPVIISAPHGGTINDKSIKNRTTGVFDIDSYTSELTREILNEFFIQTNNYPYTVILNLSRKKVDANRSLEEATNGDKKAIEVYETFHNFIKEAKAKVNKKYQKGIYIDIHGQSHSHGCIEFGYLLVNDILKIEEEKLETYKDKSSIKTMGRFSKYSFVEQIKGEKSLSGLMQKEGFKSIPSKEYPYDKNGDYFEGAYNTLTYSSLDGSNVSSIQAEFPFKGCRDTKANRAKTAKSFVSSLVEFMKEHFEVELKS